jgi:hypothetical protein
MPQSNDTERVIEPCANGTHGWDGKTYAVYEYGEYPESSVLAGQTRRSFIDSSEDLEQLKRDHLGVPVSESSGYVPVNIPSTPPDWFDPTYAGESWNGPDDDYR